MKKWDLLINTLEHMERYSKPETPKDVAKLKQSIVKLGHVAKELQDESPPDHARFLMIHSAVNRLGQALPAEKEAIQGKITGLLKRSQAQKAYQNLEKNK